MIIDHPVRDRENETTTRQFGRRTAARIVPEVVWTVCRTQAKKGTLEDWRPRVLVAQVTTLVLAQKAAKIDAEWWVDSPVRPPMRIKSPVGHELMVAWLESLWSHRGFDVLRMPQIVLALVVQKTATTVQKYNR